jgi:hypothetical protein
MTIAFAGMFNSLDFEKFVYKEEISDCGLRESFMSMNERVKYEGKIFVRRAHTLNKVGILFK